MSLPESVSSIFNQYNKSYKMLVILALLDSINVNTGKAPLVAVENQFTNYQIARENEELPVDPPPRGLHSWSAISSSLLHNILKTPYESLDRILEIEKQSIGFKQHVWEELDSSKLEELRNYAQQELERYFSRVSASFSFREEIRDILNGYLDAKKESIASHPLAILIRHTIPQHLNTLLFVKDFHIVKGSAGRPNWANMPWIAIMDTRITSVPNKGYYVCYIFSSDMQCLYLTLKHSDEPLQGVSKRDGLVRLKSRVKEIRRNTNFGTFETDDLVSYESKDNGTNYLLGVISYKRYDRDQLPDDSQLFDDLRAMVDVYESIAEKEINQEEDDVDDSQHDLDETIVNDVDVKTTIRQIAQYIQNQGFQYPENLIENFYMSMKTKPFTILAGISGTGKTKLVKLFAQALGATKDNDQFELIPVRPDWSDPSDLLGYTDLSGAFRPGPLTKVLVEASKPENLSKPYFICLDEMNLARVEHYFSDMLSILETQEWQVEGETKRIITNTLTSNVTLTQSEDRERYGSLSIPENVFLIGTVNMDETTHPFSKKVLDRANTIEFNYIDLNQNLQELVASSSDAPEPIRVHTSFLRSDYLTLKDAAADHQDLIQSTTAKLVTLNNILEEIHFHIGFRVRDAICFYMIYNNRYNLMEENRAFDFQLLQKILPRIQGSNASVRRVLILLLSFATGENYRSDDLMDESTSLYKWVYKTRQMVTTFYPESAKKIAFMLRRLEEDGFTSFWLS